jgi:hypothetical protein
MIEEARQNGVSYETRDDRVYHVLSGFARDLSRNARFSPFEAVASRP